MLFLFHQINLARPPGLVDPSAFFLNSPLWRPGPGTVDWSATGIGFGNRTAPPTRSRWRADLPGCWAYRSSIHRTGASSNRRKRFRNRLPGKGAGHQSVRTPIS